ncbi:hypothetical protein DL765_003153 [Monosporascus sp. GIB2]|nr:hypothetical protein DL765_003153 [Monosporascus sp. GIB2]
MANIPFEALSPAEQQAILNSPAMPAPDGEEVNLDNPPNMSAASQAVIAICQALSTMAIIGRLYSRFIIRRHAKADSYVATLANTSISLRMTVVPGFFIHQWNIRLGVFTEFLKMVFIQSQLYIVGVVALKVSILLEWKNIFVPPGTRNIVFWATHFMIWSCVVFYLSTIIAFNVACTPYEAHWNKLIRGSCDRVKPGFIDMSTGAIFNFVTDAVILLLPQRAIWKLKMSTKKKIGVSVVFSVGILACLTALLRLVSTLEYAKSSDFSYGFSPLTLYTAAEMTCGFLVMCMPAMPKVFSVLKKKLGIWTGSSKSRSSKSTRQRKERARPKSPSEHADERQLFPLTDVRAEGYAGTSSDEHVPDMERGIWQTTQFEAVESYDPNVTRTEYSRQEQWN